MAYDRYSRWYPAHDGEYTAKLPQDGERLEFGVHRLSFEERCDAPAWPKNPKRSADAAYRAALKRAAKDPRYIIALANRQFERATAEQGPVVNGEQFPPGYTPEAAAYEQASRAA